ncbi:MAG: FtsW/RodA/SpoVE family cell cycle protein [Lachnospiraceae bacterium]|nr:FtsW/RodA/SpoVE family cell cycle protein [Lachnospiraceae bacterium]
MICIVVLSAIGVLAINSATGGDDGLVNKQIYGALLGLAMMVIISFIDYHTMLKFSIIIYLGCCVLLVMVLVVGLIRGGARRWITLPVLGQFQPSEFVKIGLVLFFADFFGKNKDRLDNLNIILAGIGLALIPIILIILEPDTSTTIILMVQVACMFFVAGLSYKFIVIVLAVLIPLGVGFILLVKNGMLDFLGDYRIGRILAFFNKTGYVDENMQQNNSVMAIASGKLYGKGLNNTGLESVKNGNFLAEEQTDFIFAIIGEELGFIGSVVVILLFALVVFQCLRMARKAADLQGKVICTGIGMLIALQSFTNIAVATGLFPNTGLPLPFISSGVSSLLSMYLGMGIVLSVGLHPDVTRSRRFL